MNSRGTAVAFCKSGIKIPSLSSVGLNVCIGSTCQTHLLRLRPNIDVAEALGKGVCSFSLIDGRGR